MRFSESAFGIQVLYIQQRVLPLLRPSRELYIIYTLHNAHTHTHTHNMCVYAFSRVSPHANIRVTDTHVSVSRRTTTFAPDSIFLRRDAHTPPPPRRQVRRRVVYPRRFSIGVLSLPFHNRRDDTAKKCADHPTLLGQSAGRALATT